MYDLQWNTGAPYTEEGQVIRAVQIAPTKAIFHDFSRMVDGEVTLPSEPISEDHFRAMVDKEYLHSRYTYNPDAFAMKRKDRP